jgi:sugar phosphate isomerase/epimerase
MRTLGHPTGTPHAECERAIGYVARGMGERSVQEIIELLAAAGYGAVDWTLEQYDPLTESPQRLAEIVSSSHAAGLQTPQLLVQQDHVTLDPELWEERVRRAERAVRACGQAGIESIGVLTGPCPWEARSARIGRDLSERDAWDLALGALERVLDCAAREAVRVALEPCRGTLVRDRYRAEYALAYLDSVPLAVNLDPSHFVLCGDDVCDAVRAWGGRIAHVHLKDAFGVPGREGEDFTFLLPGEGSVPWPELLETLDAMGYPGAMCIQDEAHRLRSGPLRGDPARGAALALELARGLMDPPPLDPSRPGEGGEVGAREEVPTPA